MAFFVSDSPNHIPVNAPFGGGKASLKETGVLSIEDYFLVPCKVKKYNAKALNPAKALERWDRRNMLECKSCPSASLRAQLDWIDDQFALANESREFINFAALDLGGGPLANTWILVVAEGKLRGGSMRVLDIDHRALLAQEQANTARHGAWRRRWCMSAYSPCLRRSAA